MFDVRTEFSNFVGKDGFHWWVGQVESSDSSGKNSNRYKVRIVGHHLQSCEKQSTDDLPWAFAVAPTTDAYSQSGGTTTNLNRGDWVIGFFMDSDNAQQPFILGSVGSVANSRNPTSDSKNFVDPSTSGEGCAAFKNFPEPKRNPYVMNSATEADLKAATTAGNVPSTAVIPNSGQPGAPGASSLISNSMGCVNSPTTPGKNSCIIISQAECPNGQMATKMEIILSELFEMVSSSGGQVGDELFSRATGLATNYIDVATGYVNKVLAVVMQGMSWATGQIYALLQQGVQKIVEFLLSAISDKRNKNKKPPYDPKKPEKLLDRIQKFLEDNLAKIGCSIGDLYDKIAQFLTDLLMNMLVGTLSSAVCAVTGAVNNIISQVKSFIEEIIGQILGPLQDILGAIAEPLNVIGGAINTIFEALGITCSGLPEQCKKTIKDCGEGPEQQDTDSPDFLDELLAKLSGGGSFPLNCKESQTYSKPKSPNVLISGGSFLPTTPPTTPGGTPVTTTTTAAVDVFLNILIDPVDATVLVGNTATFTAYASTTDSSPVNYQWQRSNDGGNTWNNISGATSSSYTTSATVLTDDDALFKCLVSGTNTIPASDETNVATLIVNDNPINPVAPVTPVNYSVTSNPVFLINSILSINYINNYNFTSLAISPNGSGFFVISSTTSSQFVSSAPTPPVSLPQTYSVVADKVTVSEGDIIKFTITTTNVPDNTVGGYLIFGPNITTTDIVGGSLTGSFTIANNRAEVFVGIENDVLIEQDELVYFSLTTAPATTQFVILAQNQIPVVTPPTPPTPEYPIACPPIVSSNGQILNIPLCKIGSPFSTPPEIYIQSGSSGGGASAEAILDENGYLTQIKVIRPGRGYVANPPENDLNCVIRGFTIINPGLGYSGNITVYIDGDPDVATAAATNGLITTIQVKNLTKTYREYPSVRIVGDTGSGAIAIPNIICIPVEENARVSESVSVTPEGKYIDCP